MFEHYRASSARNRAVTTQQQSRKGDRAVRHITAEIAGRPE
jgi:hypothetical protein